LLGIPRVSLPDRGQNRLVHRCQQARDLTRQPVILPASGTGELVKLELGEVDFEWLADFAARTLREMTLDEV